MKERIPISRKIWKTGLFCIFIAFVLSGCHFEEGAFPSREIKPEASETKMMADSSSAQTRVGNTTADNQATRTNTDSYGDNIAMEERKVMYQANINMKVQNLEKAKEQMDAYIRNKKGYLVDSSRSRTGKEVTCRITYRIPHDSFDAFLDYLKQVAMEISSQNISGQDVTEEYVDLESRLKAKREVEKRLLALMKEATSTKDLLQVSEQLAQVQEQIEQLKGRKNYLDHRVLYSTVTIQATQVSSLNPPEGKAGTMEQMKSSFIQSVSWVLEVSQGMLVIGAALLPPAIVLGLLFLIFYAGFRLYRRYKK
ncbi:MAG: DUF4349 domain-containing protein [Thermoactinomyces sp.]